MLSPLGAWRAPLPAAVGCLWLAAGLAALGEMNPTQQNAEMQQLSDLGTAAAGPSTTTTIDDWSLVESLLQERGFDKPQLNRQVLEKALEEFLPQPHSEADSQQLVSHSGGQLNFVACQLRALIHLAKPDAGRIDGRRKQPPEEATAGGCPLHRPPPSNDIGNGDDQGEGYIGEIDVILSAFKWAKLVVDNDEAELGATKGTNQRKTGGSKLAIYLSHYARTTKLGKAYQLTLALRRGLIQGQAIKLFYLIEEAAGGDLMLGVAQYLADHKPIASLLQRTKLDREFTLLVVPLCLEMQRALKPLLANENYHLLDGSALKACTEPELRLVWWSRRLHQCEQLLTRDESLMKQVESALRSLAREAS